MPKTKKDLKETENPVKTEIKNGTAGGLKDGDLENVSGGVITIHDFCKNRFVRFYCIGAFWGACPMLIIDEKKPYNPVDLSWGYDYTVSCTKGCFSKYRFSATEDYVKP